MSEHSGVGRAVVTMVTQSSDERGMTAKGGTYNPVSVYGRDEGSEYIYMKKTLCTVRRAGVKRRPGEGERENQQ